MQSPKRQSLATLGTVIVYELEFCKRNERGTNWWAFTVSKCRQDKLLPKLKRKVSGAQLS